MVKTTLFCLKCKIELNQKSGILICPRCRREYKYINGIAIFEKNIPKFIEEYWEEKEGYLGTESYLAEFLSFRKYERILDLGCGDGRAAAAIWNLGEQIYCLEFIV
jgi:SAM-dependent methyltransferase